MKKNYLALLAILPLAFSACTSEQDAFRALDAQGFTNIEYTGYDFMSFSQDNFYHTGFTATSPSGKRVRGTVCSGLLFKNATIRF